MASWNRVVAGDVLYDVRKNDVWPVEVISVDSVTETAVCSWNSNPPRTYTRKHLEKWRVKPPSSKCSSPVRTPESAPVNYTAAVCFGRDLRAAMAREPNRQQWTFTRAEVDLILAAINHATEDA